MPAGGVVFSDKLFYHTYSDLTEALAAFWLLGARSQSASVLTSLQEVKEVRDNLNEKEAQLQDVEQHLAGLKGTAEKYAALTEISAWLHMVYMYTIGGDK